MNFEDVMNDMEEWAEQAAACLQNAARHRLFQVRTKAADTDFVTDADLRSEEIIIGGIRAKYPHHSILTEERGLIDRNSEYRWVIDPIDGTTNFIHGFPMFSISIAIQHKGVTVAGLVYSPALGMKFTAVRHRGAYLNGNRIRVSQTNDLESCLLATGFPNDRRRRTFHLAYFNHMTGKVSGIRRTGSAALDLCFVAASFLDGYWEFDLNDWDMCAGALIAEEAGGQVRRMDVDRHSLLLCGNLRIVDALQDGLLSTSPF